jgi:hypothetical protein
MYRAFGVTIRSDIALPPLKEVESASNDLAIEQGWVSPQGLEDPQVVKPFGQQAPGEHWFHVPGIARFLVFDGSNVRYMPVEGADEQSVRLFILGTCIGVIMHQRGQLVIHGNAVRVGDECVIFAGASGRGKSTLAAAFYQRGYELLTDDVAVINDRLEVVPSYPQIKIWQDTADKLGIDTTKLQRIRLQVNKYAFPLVSGFCSSPLPVRGLYILNTHNESRFNFEPITGTDKFNPLKNNTYRYGPIEGLGLKAKHLSLCAQLANHIDVTRITRPKSGFAIGKLVDLIEKDLACVEST